MSAPQTFAPPSEDKSILPTTRRLPRLGEPLLRLLHVVDRLFDRVYGSAFNPLYQTGSLIVAMLLVMLVSGLYLFLLYETGQPYQSMLEIQAQPVASFFRTLHRYSADASIALVVVHAARMFLQGRTWGARVLAWVSGLVALLVLLVSGWTGLVLVWDELALEVAVKGAGILDLVPVFPEPIASIFISRETVGSSFFFLNLFLHLALPLALLAVLGVHVVRLARPQLLPPRRVLVVVLASLAALALLWPVALAPPASLTSLPGRLDMDWYFAFWLPLANRVGPAATAGVLALLGGVTLSAAWWWRPKKAELPAPAYVDELNCRGCSQCYQDCPYGAINMVERSVGKGSEIVARVDADLCTSCGICSASCDVLRVGPPGRRGRDLLHAVKLYAAEKDLDGALVFVGCNHNPAAAALTVEGVRLERFPVECAGSVHLTSVRAFLKRGALGVVIMSCSPRDCQFRHGPRWLSARLDESRHPGLPQESDRERVLLLQHPEGELDEARDELARFAERMRPVNLTDLALSNRRQTTTAGQLSRWAARGAVSLAIVAALAAPRLVRAGAEPTSGVLRLAWSDTGAVVEVCRERGEAEREAMPAHMRSARQCSRRFLDHQLQVTVDGKIIVDRRVEAGGARQDRAGRVLENLMLSEGSREIVIEYRPLDVPSEGAAADIAPLRLERRLDVVTGRVHRVHFDSEAGRLVVAL